jgi:hypothetical protein
MFEVPNVRAAERSRPNYARELDEYARLEYPREDVRTISSQALAAVRDSVKHPRSWFSIFRWHTANRKTTARNV